MACALPRSMGNGWERKVLPMISLLLLLMDYHAEAGREWRSPLGVRRTLAEGQKEEKRDSYPYISFPQPLLQRWLTRFFGCLKNSLTNSVRQRKVCKFQINSRETFSTPMAIILGGKNSGKPNLMRLSLYKIPWLPEIKCNFECLINGTDYFSHMDKNTCPRLQKHLTFGGLKLSGSQLHLHYIITSWLRKKRELKKFCKSCL